MNQALEFISQKKGKYHTGLSILEPKFSPIPNAKKYVFSQLQKKISNLTKENFVLHLFFIYILLHIYNFAE